MKLAHLLVPTAVALLACTSTGFAAAGDADAEALLKKNKCFTCHSVDKKKDAPSYKDIAAKYKGAADAPQKLYTHLTTTPKVMVDGKEESHDALKAKDEEIKNAIRWILSR